MGLCRWATTTQPRCALCPFLSATPIHPIPPLVPRHTPIGIPGLLKDANGCPAPPNLRTPADLRLSESPTPISPSSAWVAHTPQPLHFTPPFCLATPSSTRLEV